MKVKKISYLDGQSDDYIKITSADGEIVYITTDSIISITVQTNGDIVIRCIHNESHLLQNVTKDQLEELLIYGEEYIGEEYKDCESGDNDLEI